MKEVKRTVPTGLYESYIASYLELKISWMPILKITKFLRKFLIDIKGPLLVTVLGFRYFFSIKDDT